MAQRTTTIEIPILIVGGGPVGLALAADLGLRGAPCLLIEQGEGPPDHPRASAINARSMEFMRRFGVADAVRAASAPEDFPHTALYCTSLNGFEIARIERPHHGGKGPTPESPERPQRCNQLWLDPILRDLAAAQSGVALRYRCRFESLQQEDDRVIVGALDLEGGEPVRIVAQYVVDCSGGHSPIRRAFGIPMSGSAYVGHNLSIFVRAPLLWEHHPMGKAALISFVEPAGLWRNLVMLDGRELYRFGISGKAYFDAPEAVDADRMFEEVVGKPVPHEVLSVRRWTARNVVADQYRVGRVFLAGDAAHLNHPASGLGLNTGLGDAVDLAWKLGATLSGWGGAGLLASYEIERHPVGVRNVGHASMTFDTDRTQSPHQEIAQDTAAGAAARRLMGEAIVRTQTAKFITDGIALGYRYDPSPICWGEQSLAPPLTISEYHPTTYPGSRAPHAWLAPGRSTLDAFGPGFTLMRLGADAPDPDALAQAFAARRVPLAILSIADPAIGALYERRLVLVRPDGHVAWRGDALPADPGALVERVRGGV
jgi:2-polyprenyl-6-methoxyphenol hydroxylase-like FAD-dependent oxidoreductase